VLYIIKPQKRCTLARDEIQKADFGLLFDDIHHASRGDDIPSLRLGQKNPRSQERGFFVFGDRNR